MPSKILVVDDDSDIVRTLCAYLDESGYDVATARDGVQALQQFQAESPDLVLLDVMMPELDGLEVTRTLRQTSNAPIILLTARVEETDKLVGLELGADDYITKPFSPREVLARIKAVLRRSNAVGAVKQSDLLGQAGSVHVGDVVLGISSSGVHSNGFSLVRKVVERAGLDYNAPSPFLTMDGQQLSLGEALLTPTRIYVRLLMPLIRQKLLKVLYRVRV